MDSFRYVSSSRDSAFPLSKHPLIYSMRTSVLQTRLITLRIGETQTIFKAHEGVLQQCDFLRQLLKNIDQNQPQLDVPKCDQHGFAFVLAYLYRSIIFGETDCPNINDAKVTGFGCWACAYPIAKQFGLFRLCNAIIRGYIAIAENVDMAGVVSIADISYLGASVDKHDYLLFLLLRWLAYDIATVSWSAMLEECRGFEDFMRSGSDEVLRVVELVGEIAKVSDGYQTRSDFLVGFGWYYNSKEELFQTPQENKMLDNGKDERREK